MYQKVTKDRTYCKDTVNMSNALNNVYMKFWI